MRVGDIVEATWDDHAFYFGEASSKGIVSVTSVGYLVRDTDKDVALALSRNPDGFAEVQVIDRRMLRRVKVVRRG